MPHGAAAPAANWYPDPQNPAMLRWFDGAAWTEHTAPAVAAPTVVQHDAGMRMLLPVGRSGWAIASGYLGLFSLILIGAPFALFTGLMAVRELKRNPELHGWGRTIFGLITGTIGSVIIAAMVLTSIG